MELAAPLSQVGQHQDIGIQPILHQPQLHRLFQLRLPAVQLTRIHHTDLADIELVTGDPVRLLVGGEQLGHGGVTELGAAFQQGLGKGFQRQIRQRQQGMDGGAIARRGGGRGEAEGIADDGPEQQASLGAGEGMVTHQLQQHGGAAAHGSDPGIERPTGNESADAVVVDEALHVGLCQSLRPLLQFAEIHQEHLLVGHAALQQGRGGDAGGVQNEAGFGDGLAEGIGLGRAALAIEPVGSHQGGTDAVAIGIFVTKHVEHGAIPAVDDVPEARSGMRGK